jgi:hypothetical protein
MVAAGLAIAAFGCSGASGSDVNGGSSGSSGKPGSSGGTGGGSSEGAALFDTPSGKATPGSIYGVWGGSAEDGGITFDIRYKLNASSVTVAGRCSKGGATSPVAAVTVKARVSDSEIAILESKEDTQKNGDLTCTARPKPGTIAKCAPKDEGFEHDCFTLSGTTLTLFGTTSFEKVQMTKLSD